MRFRLSLFSLGLVLAEAIPFMKLSFTSRFVWQGPLLRSQRWLPLRFLLSHNLRGHILPASAGEYLLLLDLADRLSLDVD